MVNNISDQIIGLMNYIGKAGIRTSLAPVCCGSRLLLDRAESEIRDVCMNKTGLDSGRFVRSIVASTVSDMMELVCSAYSDITVCHQKHPVMMTDIRNVIEHPKETNRRIVTSFLLLFKKLESESKTGF
jgi:hypothetical protein